MPPEPTSLASAVSRVRQKHPYAGSGEITLDASRVAEDAEALWRRLTTLAGSARERAVSKLAPHEYRLLAATARSRLTDRSARNVLSLVLDLCSLPGSASLAWEAFLIGDGDQERLREIANPVLSTAGAAQEAWTRLLRVPSPIAMVIKTWQEPPRRLIPRERQRLFDEWVAQPNIGLDRYPSFLDMVRRRLLDGEHLCLLDQREKSATIVNWVATLIPTKDRPGWYLTFLTETCPGQARNGGRERWPAAHKVCETIYQSMGAPEDGGPFWESASDDVVQSFELWLKDRQLTELLGGENDRVAFWRRYLIPMRRMERTRDRAVAFLYFDGWTAIQFVNSGHATFLFREKAVRGWVRMQEADVYSSALSYRGRDECLGSYEHRGYTSTWQRSASREVENVFEQFRRSRGSDGDSQ